MTNLDSILKNRDITLLTKVHLVKAMDVRFGLQRNLSTEELMLLKCGFGAPQNKLSLFPLFPHLFAMK